MSNCAPTTKQSLLTPKPLSILYSFTEYFRYRSDGLCSTFSTRKFGLAFSGGDVIGCGFVNSNLTEIIFTHNGNYVARIKVDLFEDEV